MVEFRHWSTREIFFFAFGDGGGFPVPLKRQAAFAGPISVGGAQAAAWGAMEGVGPGFPGCGRRALPVDVLSQAPVCVTGSEMWRTWALEYGGAWGRGRKQLGTGRSPHLDPWAPLLPPPPHPTSQGA